jgi:hypothetical protein
MHRKPLVLWSLLTMLLLSVVGLPAFGVGLTCTAGNPSAGFSETTPTTDFTDHGDGTVTHAKTGLMWKRCAEGASGGTCAVGSAMAMNWAGALKAANTANAVNAGQGFANYTDWRLPNQKELQSVIESCGYGPSINQAVFPATPLASFWSASSFALGPANAWNVDFYSGTTSGYDKTSADLHVRLVRGGQSVDSFDLLAATFSVTYNGNGNTGGSVPVDGNAYAASATVTVLGNTGALVKTGNTFAGWNTAANGSGTAYAAAATFPIAANTTLYAQWTATLITTPVPTLSEWGAIILSSLMALSGLAYLRRRARSTPLGSV